MHNRSLQMFFFFVDLPEVNELTLNLEGVLLNASWKVTANIMCGTVSFDVKLSLCEGAVQRDSTANLAFYNFTELRACSCYNVSVAARNDAGVGEADIGIERIPGTVRIS